VCAGEGGLELLLLTTIAVKKKGRWKVPKPDRGKRKRVADAIGIGGGESQGSAHINTPWQLMFDH